MIAIFLAAFIHAFGLVVCFALMRLWMWMGFLIGACEINISSCHLNCVLLYGCKRFQLFINTFFEFIWLFFRFAFQQRARLKKLDVVVSSFLQLEHEHEHLTSERRNLWSFVRSIDDNPVRWNMCVCVCWKVWWNRWLINSTEIKLNPYTWRRWNMHWMHFALVTVNQQSHSSALYSTL